MDNKPSKFLTRQQVADYTGLTCWWLEKHAHTGKGPRFIQKGRKVFYCKEDVDAWRQGPYGHDAKTRHSFNAPSLDELQTLHAQVYGIDSIAIDRAEAAFCGLNASQKIVVHSILRALGWGGDCC